MHKMCKKNVEWMQWLIQHGILIDTFQNMLTFKEIVYKIDRRKMTPANIQGNAWDKGSLEKCAIGHVASL